MSTAKSAVMIGIACLILGSLVTLLVTRHYADRSLLTWEVEQTRVAYPEPELTFTYRGKPIPQCSRCTVLIRNAGNCPVRYGTEVDNEFPLRVELEGSASILGPRIYECQDGTDAAVKAVGDSALTLTFRSLNAGETIRVQFLHTGTPDTRITMTGRLVGCALRGPAWSSASGAGRWPYLFLGVLILGLSVLYYGTARRPLRRWSLMADDRVWRAITVFTVVMAAALFVWGLTLVVGACFAPQLLDMLPRSLSF